MSYPCSSCGACCRRVWMYPAFPLPKKEDGSCIHLNAVNRCDIYLNRPLICRIDESADLAEGLNREEYYKLNIDLCNKWIEEDGMDEKYKIK